MRSKTLNAALKKLNHLIVLVEEEQDCKEMLRLSESIRQDIQKNKNILIRNYVVECSSRLKTDNSTHYVQEIVKSFRYLN